VQVLRSPPAMFTTYGAARGKRGESNRTYKSSEAQSADRVCRRAGHEIAKWLFDGENHVVGLNWGPTVHRVIDHLHPLPSEVGDARIAVVSLFGDLELRREAKPTRSSDAVDMELVSNNNAHVEQMVRRLGGQGDAIFLNVPGFVPAEYAKDEKLFERIVSLLTSHASYQRIFGSEPWQEDPDAARATTGISSTESESELRRVDTIITSFGAADAYTAMLQYMPSWLSDEEAERLWELLELNLIVGDLGGHLVASEKGSGEAEVLNFIKHVNKRLLGARPTDFGHVAGVHRQTQKGCGVVGIACGARKAGILHALLSRDPCPISRLFLDSHCALALLYLLNPTAGEEFVNGHASYVPSRTEWSPDTRALIPAAA
jgi:hypothetical protein